MYYGCGQPYGYGSGAWIWILIIIFILFFLFWGSGSYCGRRPENGCGCKQRRNL